MADTEFSVFAKALATKYKNDKKPAEFTRTLFEKIYLADVSFIQLMDDRRLRAYYYGQNDITELAQTIADDLDDKGFADYIETPSEDTIRYRCETFRPWCPDIDKDNYAQRVAGRFIAIINKAASPKAKKKPRVKVESQLTLFDPTPKDKYGVLLVAEAGSTCHGEGCPNQLYLRENGRLEFCYDVVVIDPAQSDEDTENLIAMCPSCAAKYRARGSQSIEYLQEMKRQLLDSYDDRDVSSSETVQDGVRRVLQKIPTVKPPQGVDLNYDPVPLRNKIREENVELYIRTKNHVNVYYSDVHETFQELGKEGLLRFKPFCAQVRMLYLSYADMGYDQPRIYREMTRWLHTATNEDWDYCQIVISYFIQKCEVFDVIAE